ncbi:MAG: lysylphosphatidylglycerol synthase transmembrane domain-containing protein [Bacteroidota bacterium]
MTKRALNVLLSLAVAAFLIWLASRSVDPEEFRQQFSKVSFYWLPFFIFTLLFSHFLRAERWRLLLKKDAKKSIPRSTLFAGVMFGYFMNSLVPRLGEVSRPVYVAKKEGLSSSNLLGTIVLERLVDICSMLILMAIVALTLSREFNLLEQLLGIGGWRWYTYLILPLILLIVAFSIWGFYRILVHIDNSSRVSGPLLQKIIAAGRSFGEGMISVRNIKNWPVFLLLTVGIWAGYIAMTYIPFYMLDLHNTYGLTLQSAMLLTVVSSVGVSIPTPAGIGSYHLLIQQSMWLVYSVPLATALTFATVAHAVTILLVLVAAPLALWFDKYHTLKTGDAR